MLLARYDVVVVVCFPQLDEAPNRHESCLLASLSSQRGVLKFAFNFIMH